ncbi:MAG: hypothetical protein OEX05_09765 [Chloroflexota bacterium]|nr:hypothetical protein [Chloroflexota bacterium]
MADGVQVAAGLMVLGSVVFVALGLYPPMFGVWTASREEHFALVLAHPLAWRFINAGFLIVCITSAAGLVVLAGSLAVDDGPRAVMTSAAVAYAIAGALWCAIVAMRVRTTPSIAKLVEAGSPMEPAETIFTSAVGGLFGAYILASGAALIAIGLTLAIAGGVAAPVAWVAVVIGAAAIGGLLVLGDIPPFILYIPTLLIGIALLAGWT